jgi:hypothetical protein
LPKIRDRELIFSRSIAPATAFCAERWCNESSLLRLSRAFFPGAKWSPNDEAKFGTQFVFAVAAHV